MTSCLLVTKLTSDTILHVAHSWETIRKIPDFEKVAGEKLFRRYVTNKQTSKTQNAHQMLWLLMFMILVVFCVLRVWVGAERVREREREKGSQGVVVYLLID
jgi:hypothetical protein